MNSEIYNTYAEDLGTAVIYKERPLYPEVCVNPDRKACETLASSDNFLYSSTLNSEYIDFAKYEFKFNLKNTDFWSYLLPNLYNHKEAIKIFGDEFDTVSTSVVPQLSDKEISGEPDKHFFGKMTLEEEMVFLLRLPRDVRKVEFYMDRVSTNHGGSDFWEYSVFGEELEVIPDLVITFGPGPWPKIANVTYDGNDLSVFPEDYAKRYQYEGVNFLGKGFDDPTKEGTFGYLNFEDVMEAKEYSKIYQEEISSEKMLYVVIASNGSVSKIDLFSPSYTTSHNRYRHMNENVLRYDEVKSGINPRVCSLSGRMILDARSKTLLGVMDGGSFPILESIYDGISEETYSPNSPFPTVGNLVCPREMSVLGEIPEISPFWMLKDNLETGSFFNKYYIICSGKGESSPSGIYYLKSGSPLVVNVTPKNGYLCSGYSISPYGSAKKATQSGNKYTFTGLLNEDTITIIFRAINYDIRLKLSCPGDSTNYGEDTVYYQEDYGDHNIELIYFEHDLGDPVPYLGPPQSIEFNDNKPFMFWITLDSSLYYFEEGHKFYCQGKELPVDEEGYNVLTVDPGLSNFDSREIEITGTLTCKRYSVRLETASEVQLDGKNATLEYGSGYKARFAYEDGRDLTSKDIRVLNLDTGKVETSSNIWEISEVRSGGINIVTFNIPARDRSTNPNGGIRNNYIIYVGYEDQ